MNKWTLLLLVLVGVLPLAHAQMKHASHSFISKTYNKERQLSIYLPSVYEKDTIKDFPVMYVFDGQYEVYTQMVSSIVEYNSANKNGLPFIIVAIHSTDRWEEFLPKNDEKGNLLSNVGSKRLSTFLNKEVETFLKEKYRVNPMRVATGHSLGGTFVLQEMIQPKSLFQAGIIISPNIIYNDNELSNQIVQFFENPKEAYRYFFVRSGTVGSPETLFNQQLEKLATELTDNKNAKEMWNFKVIPDENHMSIFPIAFLQGYQSVCATYEFTATNIPKDKKLKTDEYVCLIKDFQKKKAKLYQTSNELTAQEAYRLAFPFRDIENYSASIAVLNLAEEINQNDSQKDTASVNQLANRIVGLRKSIHMTQLNEEALAFYREGNIKEAAQKYKEAFALNHIQATHVIRITAVPILTEAGEKELAFEQLELLANTFKLQGNHRFIADERCQALHKDKRWKLYMKILEENGR